MATNFLGKIGMSIPHYSRQLTSVAVSENISMLKGVRVRGNVKFLADKQIIHSEDGEIQFTDNHFQEYAFLIFQDMQANFSDLAL